MIVRQKYLGWIGVNINNVVVNSTTSFKAYSSALAQLDEAKPNPLEVELLLKCIRKNNPWAKEHIKVLEKYLEVNHVCKM